MFGAFSSRRNYTNVPPYTLSFRLTSIFFQNEEIFVQLDELDELDRISHA